MNTMSCANDLLKFLESQKFSTVMADPPWRFTNRTGKIAPEHKRLARYPTMTLEDICALPVSDYLEDRAHCYLWVLYSLKVAGHVSMGIHLQVKYHLAQNPQRR